jgi:hypothetical protein
MNDLLYILIAVVFFLLCWALLILCQRLMEQ